MFLVGPRPNTGLTQTEEAKVWVICFVGLGPTKLKEKPLYKKKNKGFSADSKIARYE